MAVAKILFFLFLYHLLVKLVDSKCPKSVQCRRLGSLEFPFSIDPVCGLFIVQDCDSDSPRIQLEDGGYSYSIRRDISTKKFIVSDAVLEKNLTSRSCFSFRNLSLPQSPSVSVTFFPNITLFKCSNQTSNVDIRDYFQNYHWLDCPIPPSTVYYRDLTDVCATNKSRIPTACSVIQLPIKSNQTSGDLYKLLSAQFVLEWNVSEACNKCYLGGGQCLSDNTRKFYCKKEWNVSEACNNCYRGGGQCLSDNTRKFYCKKGKRTLKKTFLIIGGAVTAASMLIIFLFIWRKYKLDRLFGFRKGQGNQKDIEHFLNNGNLAPVRYKYADIKKMTNSFIENLGKGGYGNVYKGKLLDGRLVAVKILNESKGNGEEFVNEVASISRTSHINIVSLLGFCFEGSNRALIYEFMPNGSLEKFIQDTASSSAEGGLGWQKLFEIAPGIARGLEYLHQGCRTRIVHFDIKPHNILLDEDLNPRISDFGLAKLYPNRSNIISMSVARGTIGYIAPEVTSRSFGEVSDKSDVYSYGIMVLEIAEGRKNFNPENADHTSEIYFSQHMYKQLEMEVARGHDHDLARIMNEDESQSTKIKLMIVGLWCIQMDPKDRPSMSKVVEMLEGKLESLQVPPRPYISSPSRSTPIFLTSESI